MITITKSAYITMRKNHRALWRWLSNHTDKDKDQWPGWEQIDSAANNCFLCTFLDCRFCPLQYCMDYSADYYKWSAYRGSRSTLALKIMVAVPPWTVYMEQFPEAIDENDY